MTKGLLTIFVTDFGHGFNPEEVKKPDINNKIGGDHKTRLGFKTNEITLRWFDY